MKLPTRFPLAFTALAAMTAHAPAVAGPLAAQSGREIVETAVERYEARVADIDDYTVIEEMNGTEMVAYYEKRTVDGRPVFVRLDPADQALSRAGLTWLQLQQMMTHAFSQAGLQTLAGQLEGSSRDELATLVASMGQRLAGPESGDVAGAARDALVRAGTDALKDALVDAAIDAGLQDLATGIGGAAGPPVAAVIQALRDADGFGDALGNLAGALPRIAGAALPGGQAPGGMPGMNGLPGGPMGANIASDPRSLALSAAASAGVGMLVGMGTRAVKGLLSGDEVDPSGDPYAVLRRLSGQAELVGSETLDDHPVWVLNVPDPDGLELGGEFSPAALTFRLDREDYVLREVRLEGEMELEGGPRPVSVRVTLDDYRTVDGMLHPFRTMSVIEGLDEAMSEDERAEISAQMEQARRQMAQMQEQLEDLPPEQRRMIEQQLEQMGGMTGIQEQADRQMTALADGRMERVVWELRVNQGPPEPTRPGTASPPGG